LKRLTFLTIMLALIVCGINAQIFEQANVAWIQTDPNGGADPVLCVFGNTIDDIILIDHLLDLDGKEVMYLPEREEIIPFQYYRLEMERLNARFLSVHIVQRRFDEVKIITDYFLVYVIERIGDRYYIIASNF